MSLLLVIAFAYLACRIVPRLLAELVATVIGVWLVIANRRARATLLRLARPIGTATWEQKPGRAERRAMRKSLAAAIALTEFTSLLPTVAIRAHKLTRM
jgi:hypothetical protein